MQLNRTALHCAALLVVMAIMPGTARAAGNDDPSQDPLMLTAGFLDGHPDLRHRLAALKHRDNGDHVKAYAQFELAARYADKPSQAMLAELHWNGVGTAQDRALAYAWMDMAAERGYQGFLELRERYWARLDEDQRTRALSEGHVLYARYGDAVAQPRLANIMRRERRNMTGTRTGAGSGNLRIVIPGPAGDMEIDGSRFYDPRFWDPVQYQAWHDSVWMKPRVGRVDLGELSHVGDDNPAPPTQASEPAAARPQASQADTPLPR
jgi:hypothetical protein